MAGDFESLVGSIAATARNPKTIDLELLAGTYSLYTPDSSRIFAVRMIYLTSKYLFWNTNMDWMSSGTTIATTYLPQVTSHKGPEIIHAGGYPIMVGRAPGESLELTTDAVGVAPSGFVTVDELTLQPS